MSGRSKSRGGRHGHSGQHASKENEPPIDLTSPVTQEFFRLSQQLDARHDKHEALVKRGRDVTIDSKKIIFLLHRIHGSENRAGVLKDAEQQLTNLQKGHLRTIAGELKGEEPYLYLKAYTWGLQEYVEALSFYHYISTGELISYTSAKQTLQYEEVDAENTTTKLCVLLTVGDFMLGLADLTGELMRQCINSVGSGDTAVATRMCVFLRDIYNAFLLIGNGAPREFFRKLHTLRQSLQKVEVACYTLQVRGSEIPKHMLKDVFTGGEEEEDEGLFV
jgi:predicted translin family RNA/ssDNA-binding protein